MYKTIINKCGVHYLLGEGNDGKLYYLQREYFSATGTWIFGHIHTYSGDEFSGIDFFDDMFLSGPWATKMMFDEFFKETPLSDDEVWLLCDLMKSYYTLSNMANLIKLGYSHEATSGTLSTLSGDNYIDKINKIILPELFGKVETIFMS